MPQDPFRQGLTNARPLQAPVVQWPPPRVRKKLHINYWLILGIGAGVLALAVVGVLMVVIIGAVGKSYAAHQNNRAAMDRMNQQADALASKALDQSQGDEFQPISGDYAAFADEMDKNAAQMTGKDAIIARASARTLRGMLEHLASYEKALQSLIAAGSIDPQTIKSAPAIDKRLQMVHDFRIASDKIAEAARALPDRFESELTKSNLSAETIRVAIAGFRTTANIDLGLQIRAEDTVICEDMKAILTILKKGWGRWDWDQQQQAIIFENESSLTKYNHHVGDLQAAAERQAALQRQLLRPRRK